MLDSWAQKVGDASRFFVGGRVERETNPIFFCAIVVAPSRRFVLRAWDRNRQR
jgi:hypothetical protein